MESNPNQRHDAPVPVGMLDDAAYHMFQGLRIQALAELRTEFPEVFEYYMSRWRAGRRIDVV